MTENQQAIDAAKALISDHEQLANEGNLEKISANFAEDIVLLTADTPLVVGLASFRDFYGSLLEIGKWEFLHHYEGVDVVGDSVTLYGVSRGTLIPDEGDQQSFANNFIITVKQTSIGLKIWRAAFASAGES